MNYLDLFIIYLTCGMPFGVYYYFQTKEYVNVSKVWINSFLITLLWIPYAVKLLQVYINKKLQNNNISTKSEENFKSRIAEFEKKFSQFLVNNENVSLFDFRETYQRFVGLTLYNSEQVMIEDTLSQNLTQLVEHENPQLFAICYARRNRFQLIRHQTIARQDFLLLLQKLNVAKNIALQKITLEFAQIIDDSEFTSKIKEEFENSRQINIDLNVNSAETNVWNPIEPKQLLANQKTLNLQTMTAKANILNQE